MGVRRLLLEIKGMWCEGCAINIEEYLKSLRGVRGARVDYGSSKAVVEFEEGEASVSDLVNSPIFRDPSPYRARVLRVE